MRLMRCSIPVLLALGLATPLAAANQQEISAILTKAYHGQRMMQRTFYGGSRVRYAADGRAIKAGDPGPWTLDAGIQPQVIKVKRRKLIIQGNRLYFIYYKKENKLRPYLGPKVEIDIATSQDMTGLAGVQQSIARVFVAGQERLIDFVPDYWKDYLLHPNAPVQKRPRSPLTAGKESITAPHVISAPEPPFTPEASKIRMQGTVILTVVVGENGRVAKVTIVRPLGMGLDDSAARTVRKWKFKPATRKGRPVAVRVRVETAFKFR